MKILHLTDHYLPTLGGIETHVSALAHHQAARGDDVTVLTSTTAGLQAAPDRSEVRVRRATWSEGMAFDPEAFDVVHAHLSVVAPFTAPVAARAARRGVPTVVTVHSLWDGLGPLPTWAARLSGLRSAPVRWTSVSGIAARELSPRLPPGTHVAVLPNAVDATPRAETPTRANGIPVRLVSTMRVARRKRPLGLIRMYAELVRRTDVPTRLVVVGDGPLRSRLEHEAARRGLAEAVTVTGRLAPDQVLATLAACDVYIAPALQESFGLAALEARCVGLPVVGHAASGLTEFVRSGTEGLLCRDDADMVDALQRLVEHTDLRRRMSEHNRTTRSELTWAKALNRHDDLYALGRRAARSGAASYATTSVGR